MLFSLGPIVKLCVLCPSLVSLCLSLTLKDTRTDTIMGVVPPPQTIERVTVELQSSVIHRWNRLLKPDSVPHINHRVN